MSGKSIHKSLKMFQKFQENFNENSKRFQKKTEVSFEKFTGIITNPLRKIEKP